MRSSRNNEFFSKWNFKLLFIVFVLILGACSGFEKILKSKDYEFKYKKALEYYENKDHYRYITLLEQLSPIYKGTMRSDTIEFYLAQGYYHQGDYLLAGHYYDKFRKTFPRSAFTEESDFMYAYCFYKSSPRPELDQDNTQAAIAAFAEFVTRYPNTKKFAEVNKLVLELREKLVEKSYLSSKLYYKIGDYKAAIVAIRNSVKEYPNSKHREELLFLILKSSYLLADNSIVEKQRERFQSTVDEYYTFIGEFPNSQYVSEAKKMYEYSMDVLKKLN
ncbi:MAG: outer membrane protein assembly factor BamD [Bacteroidales bacterium]|nr:MAG: outer membrane protein assembly factor BamD [Bacteroidales bacterium]